MVVEPVRADLPGLLEEVKVHRGTHRPHPEVEPARRFETPHRRVDHRKPRAPVLPGGHQVGVVLGRVEPLEHRVHRRVEPAGPVFEFLLVVSVPEQPRDEHLFPAAVGRVLVDVLVDLPDGETAEGEIRRETAGPVACVRRGGDVPRVVVYPLGERRQSVARGTGPAAGHVGFRGRDIVAALDCADVDPGVEAPGGDRRRVPVVRVGGEPRRHVVLPAIAGLGPVPDQPVAVDERNVTLLPCASVPLAAVPPCRRGHRHDVPAGRAEPL